MPPSAPCKHPAAARRDAVELDDGKTADEQAIDAALRALPELPVPPQIWLRVRQRTASDNASANTVPARRKRRIVPLALAAGVLLFAAATALLRVPHSASLPRAESEPGYARVAESDIELQALLAQAQRLEAARHRSLAVLVPTDAERLLRARIGGIDASLNNHLLDASGSDSRKQLLRQRVQLMESLLHIERNRQREFVRQAAF